MNQQREIDKTMVARAVISKIQDESNPEHIKAKYIKEFEVPGKVTIKGRDGGYAPDIAAEFPKVTDVYQIELNNDMPVDKWRLFSLYAKKKTR